MARRSRCPLFAAVAFLLCACVGSAFANNEIDLDLNPVTGLIEAVAVSPVDGDRIRHLEDTGQGGAAVDTVVSIDPAADSRIAIKSTGESWVVWHDEISGEVRFAYRDSATKVWTPEATLSMPGEPSGKPSIAHNDGATWVAYEIGEGPGRSVAVTGIEDSPEPFPTRTIVMTTSSNGALDVTLHSETGHVWLTWIDAPTSLGWSAYDHETGRWSPAQVESFAGSTLAGGLESVRQSALAP